MNQLQDTAFLEPDNIQKPDSSNKIGVILLVCTLCVLAIFPILMIAVFNVTVSFHPELDVEYFFRSLFFMFIWVFLAIYCLILTLFYKMRKLTLSFIILLIGVWPMMLFVDGLDIGDYVHFAKLYPVYKKKIETLPPGTRLTYFWGGSGLPISVSCRRNLVYDPTDKIPQENAAQERLLHEETRYMSGGHEYDQASVTTQRLAEHFYLVEECHY